MGCPKEARKRCKTITFWLTPGQLAEIDELVRLSGLTKQDYLTRRALDKQVTIVPSSRVAKSLKSYAERIVNKLDALTVPAQLDDDILLDEIRWLSALMAAFARYGEEDFDAVERILDPERDYVSSMNSQERTFEFVLFVNK